MRRFSLLLLVWLATSPAAAQTSGPAWRWQGPWPVTDARGRDRSMSDPGGLECGLRTDAAGVEELACRRGGQTVWQRRRGGARYEGNALIRWGEHLLVARHGRITSGCWLYAYDLDTGRERWRTELLGIGPVAHSAYTNAVELGLDEDRVVIYGREAMGRYVEVRTIARGELVTSWRERTGGAWQRAAAPAPIPAPSAPPLGPAQRVPWTWSGPDLMAMPWMSVPREARSRGRWCRFTTNAERATTLGCGTNPSPDWTIDIADDSEHAQLLLRRDVLYVVRYHPIASGATALAYDAASGRELWRRRLWALGPIDHSQYRAEVQLRWVAGRLAVFGWELGGRYIAVVDPPGGALVGHRILP